MRQFRSSSVLIEINQSKYNLCGLNQNPIK